MHIRRCTATAMLLMALLIAVIPLLSESARAETMLARGYVDTSKVNLRSGPGTNYAMTATLTKDVALDIYEVTGEWLRVKVTGASTVGYVYAKYVSLYSDSFTGYGFGLITGNVHMRSKASTDGKSKAICRKGDVIRIISVYNSKWYKAENDSGVTGYVSATYCKLLCKKGKSSVTPTPTATPVPLSGTGYLNTSNVNFRSGPGTGYASYGKLARNTEVELLGQSGNWYQIRVKATGKTGWVSSTYITKGSSSSDTPMSAAGFTNTSNVNFRSGPGTNYASYGKLVKNTQVTITAVNGSWYKVTLNMNGMTGYISKSYVTLMAQNTVSPTSGYINASEVHLRKEASASSKKLATLAKNTPVIILEKSGDWYRVQLSYNGTTGYVYRTYVTAGSAVITPVPTAVVVTPVPMGGGAKTLTPLITPHP